MVRPKETDGMALSYALAQECEKMARILAWSRRNKRIIANLIDMYPAETDQAVEPKKIVRQVLPLQEYRKVRPTNRRWQYLSQG